MRTYEGNVICPNCGQNANCIIDTRNDKLIVSCIHCNHSKEDIGNWNIMDLMVNRKGE